MSKAVKKAARKFRKIQKLHSEGQAGKAELKRMQSICTAVPDVRPADSGIRLASAQPECKHGHWPIYREKQS